MKKQTVPITDATTIRQKAEDKLKKQQSKINVPVTEAEILKLYHELQVHQIELEMQNKELVIAKEKAETAEEKYSELYDFAPTGYISLTQEKTISELNFVAAKMLGKERAYLIKKRFDLFVSVNTRAIFDLFFNEVFTGKMKQTCEVIIEPVGSSPLYVKIDGVVGHNGDLCFLTLDDISEKNQKHKELIAAKEHAEECDRLKSAFLANMSHEIRTPMNGILGFSELLKSAELTGAQQQEYIQIIEKSGIRMLNIINNIIDISKIEAGLMKLDIRESNINEQIEYIYTFFKPEVEAKGMKITFINSLPSKESIIYTDREKVYAIFTNLIKNAIKFSNKGSIELGYFKRGDFLEFYLKDTGIGIPTDRQTAIFERFVQADIAGLQAQQGAGLGLSISKAYVEMLDGKIWVESEEGIGSTFYFTLPYKTRQEKIELQKNNPFDNIDNRATPRVPGLKILVAEDDETSEMLLDIELKIVGKEILKAKTGAETVELCRNNPDIDLVLMDIRMPEMSGYEATKQIRKFNKDVVIIAQTAYGLTGDREKAINAGCNDYIAKPIKKDELLALIEKCFRK
jgi:signal transduction histidine kinase